MTSRHARFLLAGKQQGAAGGDGEGRGSVHVPAGLTALHLAPLHCRVPGRDGVVHGDWIEEGLGAQVQKTSKNLFPKQLVTNTYVPQGCLQLPPAEDDPDGTPVRDDPPDCVQDKAEGHLAEVLRRRGVSARVHKPVFPRPDAARGDSGGDGPLRPGETRQGEEKHHDIPLSEADHPGLGINSEK